MSDDEFRKIWKYSYKDVVAWCRSNIPGFKQTSTFYEIKKKVEEDINCAYKRRLDSRSAKSPSKVFYTDKALEGIKAAYAERLKAEEEPDK